MAAGCAHCVTVRLANAESAAEPETATLDYGANEAAAGACPDETSFRRRVAARLGYQPFMPGGRHRVGVTLFAEGTVVRVAATVTRDKDNAPGTREFAGALSDCDDMVDALATAVAIALDPVRGSEDHDAAPPRSPPRSPPTTAPAPRPVPAPPAPPPEKPAEPVRVFGVANAIGTLGLLPGAAIGGSLGAGVTWRALSIELAGRVETMPGTATADTGDRVEATALAGSLAPCGQIGIWLACAVGRLGSLQGRAPDVANPSLGTSLFGTAGAKTGVSVPVSRLLAVRAMVGAEFALVRTSLLIDEKAIWTAPPVMGGLDLGVVVTLP